MHSDAHDTTHPCFGSSPREAVLRLHLPVAPRSNLRLRFGSPRPAASAPAIQPAEALAWLADVIACGEPVGMVGITGPGEPLATPEITLETLRLVRAKFPGLPLCLTTNGLLPCGADNTPAPRAAMDALAAELKALNISHVTVLVDAVRPEVAEKLYAWIRPGLRTLPLPVAAALLVDSQRELIRALAGADIPVKVNTTVYTGLNAGHVEEVARAAALLGASIMNILPCPAPPENNGDLFGDGFADETPPSPPGSELLAMIRDRAARHMPLMTAFEECGDACLERPRCGAGPAGALLPAPSEARPNVAVCSVSGMEIDLHLGQAPQFLIYGRREGLPVLLEARPAPEPGNGKARWEQVAETLSDCFALLAAGAGESPRKTLGAKGIRILVSEDGAGIDPAVDALFGGGRKPGCGKKGKS